MDNPERPIRALSMQVGRGDWQLIIPGGAQDGSDVTFWTNGGIRGATPSTVPANLEGLAQCLNRRTNRIISDRDGLNGELGKAKGQIEHLKWMLATDDPTTATERDVLRRELLLGLAELSNKQGEEIARLTRELEDARSEVEEAKKAAFGEIERRKAAEKGRDEDSRRVRELMSRILTENRTFLNMILRTYFPERSEKLEFVQTPERKHFVIIGNLINEPMGCGYDREDVLHGEPDAWFIEVPEDLCTVDDHGRGIGEEGDWQFVAYLLSRAGWTQLKEDIEKWSPEMLSTARRWASYVTLAPFDHSHRLKPFERPRHVK
jgi:hypothetical protein